MNKQKTEKESSASVLTADKAPESAVKPAKKASEPKSSEKPCSESESAKLKSRPSSAKAKPKRPSARSKAHAAALVAALEELYPEAECALKHGGDPWRLLVMARLSAQCTDARVNIVSEELFRRCPDCRSMAEIPLNELEELVKPCGLYHTKAKNLKEMSIILQHEYGAGVPETMEELLRLPGVGRKIANLILGDVFGKPAVVTDTHCIRLSGRLGLCESGEKNPLKVEKALCGLIEPEKQSDFCHRLVMFGREYCRAQSPRCGICPLIKAGLCAGVGKNASGDDSRR